MIEPWPLALSGPHGGDAMNAAGPADAATRRHKDENGFLHVAVSHISKEAVNPYYGREIPGWEKRGLDPERIYYGWRAGPELARAASTFNGLPLLRDHHVESAEAPQKQFRVGSLGTEAVFRAPYLDNALIVTDADAIRDIENGTRMALSAAYLFEPDFTPGVFAGQPYDFVMTAIRGNHVALVAEGRAGPDVVVADTRPAWPVGTRGDASRGNESPMECAGERHAAPARDGIGPRGARTPNNPQPIRNSMTGIIDALKALVREAEKLPAQDDAGENLSGPDVFGPEGATEEENAGLAARDDESAELTGRLVALVDTFDDRELAEKLKAWINRLAGKDAAGVSDGASPDADNGTPAQPAAGSSAVAGDAALPARIKRQAADDAVRRFRDMAEAARAVRPLAGNVDPLAFDSAEDIYAKALELSGVRPLAYPRAAWRGMVDMLARRDVLRPGSSVFAQDAAPSRFDGPFAHLANINIAR